MEANFPVNHNYYEEKPLNKDALRQTFGRSDKDVHNLFNGVTEIVNDPDRFTGIKISGFRPINHNKEPDLILKCYKKNGNQDTYIVQTGLYAGILYHKKCKFNITSGYGNVFLHRMLSFANDVFIDTDYQPAVSKQGANEFEQIITWLFCQSLEKSAMLGLPQQYTTECVQTNAVSGRIDLHNHLKKEIPFRGKLSNIRRVKHYVLAIIDVLYYALSKVNQHSTHISNSLTKLRHVLKQHYSGKVPTTATIKAAKESNSLNNPMFTAFRKTLSYAEVIINNYKLETDEKNQAATTGYLFDIAQLFEVYLEKLLRHHITDWHINAQYEIKMYDKMFYGRKMIPDIVMENKINGAIAVFDVKYKKMRLNKRDLDREDFYQIHTYIQYFEQRVIAGGLLYPLSSDESSEKSRAYNLFGLSEHKTLNFVVDGIKVDKEMIITDFKVVEGRFIDRMKSWLTKSI